MTVTNELPLTYAEGPADQAELEARLVELAPRVLAAAEAIREAQRRHKALSAEAGALVAVGYERGYKLAKIARAVGVDRGTLYNWMTGGRRRRS